MDDFSGANVTSSAEARKPRFSYSCIIVLACFLILFVVYGAQFTFGIFFKPMLAEFGWTRAATSGAYSLYMVMQGMFGIVAGKLSDMFGPRLVVSVCGLFVGFGYLLMSQVGAVWQIYLFYGVFAAIGAGSWVPVMSTVARWFIKKRGLVSGIVASGVGVGSMIMPLLAGRLISNYSWRISYIIIGSIAFLVNLVVAQFLRRDPSQEVHFAPHQHRPKTEGPESEVQEFSPR